MAEDNNLQFPFRPLTKEKALQLETVSSQHERLKNLVDLQLENSKRFSSTDNFNLESRKSLFIVS